MFGWVVNTTLSTTPFFIKPFHVIGLLPCPVKTSENLWLSDVFRGIERDQ